MVQRIDRIVGCMRPCFDRSPGERPNRLPPLFVRMQPIFHAWQFYGPEQMVMHLGAAGKQFPFPRGKSLELIGMLASGKVNFFLRRSDEFWHSWSRESVLLALSHCCGLVFPASSGPSCEEGQGLLLQQCSSSSSSGSS